MTNDTTPIDRLARSPGIAILQRVRFAGKQEARNDGRRAHFGRQRKLAEITGLIDSIAFQTNSLALNAAVEAARAGETMYQLMQNTTSIQELDANKQHNAAMVEQTSAAAAALEQQAQHMMQQIARFQC